MLLSSSFGGGAVSGKNGSFGGGAVSGKNGKIRMSLLKQESKIPQYLKYGDLRSVA
jgi:hypothetical protein